MYNDFLNVDDSGYTWIKKVVKIDNLWFAFFKKDKIDKDVYTIPLVDENNSDDKKINESNCIDSKLIHYYDKFENEDILPF